MKYQHIKWFYSRPIFMKWGNHCCPICGEELKKIKVSKIVNSESEEAKDYDFSSGDVYMYGDVKFVWTEFNCEKCDKNFSVDDVYHAEKELKRAKRRATRKIERK